MKNGLKWVITVVLVVVFAIVVMVINGSTPPDLSPPHSTDQAVEAAKTKDADPNEYKMGDVVKVKNLAYEVHRMESAKQIGSGVISEKADGYFLMVNLTVTNQGKESQTIDSSMFTLVDKDDTVYGANGAVAMYIKGNNNFFLEKLNPKVSKTGYVVFDVPTVKGDYSLRVTGGLRSEDYALIRLGK